MPEDIDDTLCKSDPCENKSQVKDVDTTISIIYNDQSNNYNNNNHVSIKDEDHYSQETNEFLLSSLLTSLQSKFTQSSLLMSLRSKFLLSFLLASLWYGFLLLSLLALLRYGFLQSSLLVSIRNIHVHISTPISLWNLFLRFLFNDIFIIIRIWVKPEIHFYQYIYLYKGISTVTPLHTKPEISKLWILSCSLLQPYMKYFHKLIAYYIIEYNHYI